MGRDIIYFSRRNICFLKQQGEGAFIAMKEGLAFILFLIVLTSICDTINQLFLKSAIKLFIPIKVSVSSKISRSKVILEKNSRFIMFGF